MESVGERRLKAIHRHLISPLAANSTSGELFKSDGYSVIFSEKLNSTPKWNVYRSARSPLEHISRFPNYPEIGTLHDNFVSTVERYPDNKYLGSRVRVDGTIGEYEWMTYAEVSSARSSIGSALQKYGLLKGGCIGLYFINRPEWVIVDHACSAYSFVTVPLYDTLGPDAVKYIVNHADVQVIFCVPTTLDDLLSFVSEIPNVRLIVVVDGVDENLPSLPATCGTKLTTFSKLLNQGRINMKLPCPPSPDDIATICYTSGTTGTPKGAILTHGGLIANAAGASFSFSFDPNDVYISYLPLAHIYERVMQVLCAHFGVAVGFYHGDNLKLMDDLAVLRPTIFCSVPRVYNKIYSGIINSVKSSGPQQERQFYDAFNSKKQALMNGEKPSAVLDRLVFDKIKATLGGRVRVMYSGASPISPDVLDFMKIKEIVDEEGWLHTGDIGLWSPGGRLKIIDRKKNIFKLAQGEYVAPEKTENVYAKCKFVSQCFVYGDSLKSYLVAVVCVDHDVLKAWAATEGIKYKDMEQLCQHPRAREVVLAEMNDVGRKSGLRGFEYAKAVTLVLEPLTLESGLLTPTMKIKRPQAKEYFAKAISEMYNALI